MTRAILLTPLVLRRPACTAEILRRHARLVIGVAVLSPLSYVLVLHALRLAPVSVVAPAREMSIVLGALLGTRLLGEPGGRQRVVAAIAVVLGIAMLAG